MTKLSDAGREALARLEPSDRLRALIGLWPVLSPRPSSQQVVALRVDEQDFSVEGGGANDLHVRVGRPAQATASVKGTAAALWSVLGERQQGTDVIEADAPSSVHWLQELGGDDPAAALAAELSTRGPAIGLDALERSFVGQAEQISEADLRAFAEATSDDNRCFVDGSREGGIIAPPLFPVRFFNPMFFQVFADPHVQMDFSRLLFGEMALTFIAPLRAGETVLPEARTLSLQDKETGQLLRVFVRLSVQGQARCEGVATFFVRWKKRTRIQRLKLPGAPEPTLLPLFSRAYEIRKDQAKLFAVAGRDPNPLHLDDAVARAAGLPGVILQGLCSMAFTGRAVIAELCAGDPARLAGLEVRFSRPAYPGQTLTTRAFQPTAAADGIAVYPFVAENDVGDRVITGGVARVFEPSQEV